jgi:hypothetical protein
MNAFLIDRPDSGNSEHGDTFERNRGSQRPRAISQLETLVDGTRLIEFWPLCNGDSSVYNETTDQ